MPSLWVNWTSPRTTMTPTASETCRAVSSVRVTATPRGVATVACLRFSERVTFTSRSPCSSVTLGPSAFGFSSSAAVYSTVSPPSCSRTPFICTTASLSAPSVAMPWPGTRTSPSCAGRLCSLLTTKVSPCTWSNWANTVAGAGGTGAGQKNRMAPRTISREAAVANQNIRPENVGACCGAGRSSASSRRPCAACWACKDSRTTPVRKNSSAARIRPSGLARSCFQLDQVVLAQRLVLPQQQQFFQAGHWFSSRKRSLFSAHSRSARRTRHRAIFRPARERLSRSAIAANDSP